MTKQEITFELFINLASMQFDWYYREGYITARDGNACVKLGKDLYGITASGVEKHRLTNADFVLVDSKGHSTVSNGEPVAEPSIETLGHIAALAATGKKYSVHVHSPCSTAFFSMRKPPSVDWPELTRYTKVGTTIRYMEPGSEELHRAIKETFSEEKCDIVVLANHGVLAVGNSLDECKEHIHRLEHSTHVWLKMLAAGQQQWPMSVEDLGQRLNRDCTMNEGPCGCGAWHERGEFG